MKRGTTYPITITLRGVDLTDASWIIVSFKPRGLPMIEFDRSEMSLSSDGTDTILVCQLTEAQSVRLPDAEVTVDCNWELNGIRGGAIPSAFDVTNTLLTRVVNAGG